ncbi:DUF3696 domain-containing protein [Alphaproteobacteria bacterium]|nr:DUF3696 domain-containing protein [Alphaproteobacteria bacterium]
MVKKLEEVNSSSVFESLNKLASSRVKRDNQRPFIKAIRFNNFKPFSDNQKNRIEFKPITLLYGWNNSGKSSILELVNLLSKINHSYDTHNSFSNFNANQVLGLGSYRNYIHGNDIENVLRLSYEIENITLSPRLRRSVDDDYEELRSLLHKSKGDIYFNYTKSPYKNEFNQAYLAYFGVELKNLLSLSAASRQYDLKSFKVDKLKFHKMDSNNFFKTIVINRSKITSLLSSVKSEIYNTDINPQDPDSIGVEIFKELNSLDICLKENYKYLSDLSINSEIDLLSKYGEPGEPIKNKSLQEFLEFAYGPRQDIEIHQATRRIKQLNITNSHLDNDEIVRAISDIFEMLDSDLLLDHKYINFLIEHIAVTPSNKSIFTLKKLDNAFWTEFSKYLPKKLQNGFITEGIIPREYTKKEKKITLKQLKENRKIVLNFLNFERRYIHIKDKLFKELIVDIKTASKKIKTIFPSKIDVATFSSRISDEDTPIVNIKIDEYESLIDLLNNWDDRNTSENYNKLKEIFDQSLTQSIILTISRVSNRLNTKNCLSLANFLMSIVENDVKKNEDQFFYFIENLSLILQSILNSAQRALKAQTFTYPTESIKRHYEKKEDTDEFDINDEYDFGSVFNILRNDPEVLKSVNRVLKKMGFDFHINFQTFNGLNDESLFSPLAKNIENEKINTHISDLGLGLKKIIPLITYLYSRIFRGIICIQEPESNLHPKYQSEIAEVLVESYNHNKNIHLVETHSEILVLRLLKLIKHKKISANDISINFIKKKDGVSEIINIGVNEKGEFTGKWPSGFFKERLEELL